MVPGFPREKINAVQEPTPSAHMLSFLSHPLRSSFLASVEFRFVHELDQHVDLTRFGLTPAALEFEFSICITCRVRTHRRFHLVRVRLNVCSRCASLLIRVPVCLSASHDFQFFPILDQRRGRNDEMHSITERITGTSIREPGDLDHQPASLFRRNDTTQIEIRSSNKKNGVFQYICLSTKRDQ